MPDEDDRDYGELELSDAYDRGVAEAQAFIDRHPHGWPAVVMGQYDKPEWPEDDWERNRFRGYYDRLAEEVGTEEDPEESWKAKMEALGQWPDEEPPS